MLVLIIFDVFVVDQYDKHINEINFLLLLILNVQLKNIDPYQINIVHIHEFYQ